MIAGIAAAAFIGLFALWVVVPSRLRKTSAETEKK